MLTAEDGADGSDGLSVVYVLKRRSDLSQVALKVWLADDDLHVSSLYGMWPGAGPLEREVYDLFGVVFDGHPDLTRILQPDNATIFPLRRSFILEEHPW
jgi:NADH-quinone oxidoreductase subunit C